MHPFLIGGGSGAVRRVIDEFGVVIDIFRCGYCILIRGYACPSIGPLVRLLVGPSIGR